MHTGRPASSLTNRVITELGPMSLAAPPFPLAAVPLAALRVRAEAAGSGDFSPLWCGQAGRLAREIPAAEVVHRLAAKVGRLREATT